MDSKSLKGFEYYQRLRKCRGLKGKSNHPWPFNRLENSFFAPYITCPRCNEHLEYKNKTFEELIPIKIHGKRVVQPSFRDYNFENLQRILDHQIALRKELSENYFQRIKNSIKRKLFD